VTDATKVFGAGGPSVVSSSVLARVGLNAGSGNGGGSGAPEAVSAEIINGKQFKVTFNRAVSAALAERVAFYDVIGPGLGDFKMNDTVLRDRNPSKAVLQDDGRTVIVTLDIYGSNYGGDPTFGLRGNGGKDYYFENNEEYNITVSTNGRIKDTAGNVVPEKIFKGVLFKSNVIPRFESVEVLGPKAVKLHFSEPMNITPGFLDGVRYVLQDPSDEDSWEQENIRYWNGDGSFTASSDIKVDNGSLSFDSSAVLSYPVDGSVNVVMNTRLADGEHNVGIRNLPNYTGYAVPSTEQRLTVTSKTEAPTFNIRSAEPQRVVLMFSDYVKNVANWDNTILMGYTEIKHDPNGRGNEIYSPEIITVDGDDYAKEWRIDLCDDDILNGTAVKVTVRNAASGSKRIVDMWGNAFVTASQTADVIGDETKPEALSVRVDSSKSVFVIFSRSMKADEAANRFNYVLLDADKKVMANSSVGTTAGGNPLEDRQVVYDDSRYETEIKFVGPGLSDGKYFIRASNVSANIGYLKTKIDSVDLPFEIGDAANMQLVDARYSLDDNGDQNVNSLVLTFSQPVDPISAREPSNYRIGGVLLTKQNVSIRVDGSIVVITGGSIISNLNRTPERITALINDMNGNAIDSHFNVIDFESTSHLTAGEAFGNLTLTRIDVRDGKTELRLASKYPIARIKTISGIDIAGVTIDKVSIGSYVTTTDRGKERKFLESPANYNDGPYKFYGQELVLEIARRDSHDLPFETRLESGGLVQFGGDSLGDLAKQISIASDSVIAYKSGHKLGTAEADLTGGPLGVVDRVGPRVTGIKADDFRGDDKSGSLSRVIITFSEPLNEAFGVAARSGVPVLEISYRFLRTTEEDRVRIDNATITISSGSGLIVKGNQVTVPIGGSNDLRQGDWTPWDGRSGEPGLTAVRWGGIVRDDISPPANESDEATFSRTNSEASLMKVDHIFDEYNPAIPAIPESVPLSSVVLGFTSRDYDGTTTIDEGLLEWSDDVDVANLRDTLRDWFDAQVRKEGDSVILDVPRAVTASVADASAGANKPVTLKGIQLLGDDAGKYSLSMAGLTITINKATPAWSKEGVYEATITADDVMLANAQIIGNYLTVGDNPQELLGAWTWGDPADTTPVKDGDKVNAYFTPADNTNYKSPGNVEFTIRLSTPAPVDQ